MFSISQQTGRCREVLATVFPLKVLFRCRAMVFPLKVLFQCSGGATGATVFPLKVIFRCSRGAKVFPMTGLFRLKVTSRCRCRATVFPLKVIFRCNCRAKVLFRSSGSGSKLKPPLLDALFKLGSKFFVPLSVNAQGIFHTSRFMW